MENKDKSKTHSSFVFDTISGIYGLFFSYQKNNFIKAIDTARPHLDISQFKNALDIGCGTGALCSLLYKEGLDVTGIDNSKKMLNIAVKKNIDAKIKFIHHNALNSLPFKDGEFDFSIASYVAHGLIPNERSIMLREMKRVSKHYVVLHEFNKKRKITTDIIEYLEGGNYFYFIKNIEKELSEIFDEFEIIEVGETSFWYVCKV